MASVITTPVLREELEHLATTVFKPAGSVLFRRGDDVSGVFVIHSGAVNLTLDDATPIFPDRVLGPGAMIGLPASVSGNPYTLTAKVLEDSELAFVPRKSFVECLRNDSLLCLQAMDILSDEIASIRSAFKQNGSSV
jgi:CRP-like cAMP-binding protein